MNLANISTTIFKKLNSRLPGKRLKNKTIKPTEIFYEFYEELRLQLDNPNYGIISFVFSKDRAMQLHAFLESYFENVANYSTMIVLYKASDKAHLDSYEELMKLFEDKSVIFIEEKNFRDQLIEAIEKSKEGKIFFYVDDMIFTHKFDYDMLKGVNPYKTIVSLSRGRDLTKSTVLSKTINLPEFTNLDNGLLQFSWNNIKEHSDWSYPLGVSGYMFATKEILSIMKVISFKAPNSLENGMQQFKSIFIQRMGLCTENAVSICVHANLTQTEGYNPVFGEFSIEELLDKWNEGYQIEYFKFYSKPVNAAQIQEYTFCQREG
tara:strand:- start:7799 stop:8761 length:963 start_codon:yes stop_codon:yes gene_type:complete